MRLALGTKPEAQGWQGLRGSDEKVMPVQATHDVPDTSGTVPPGQKEHTTDAGCRYMPFPHREHSDDRGTDVRPVGQSTHVGDLCSE